MKRIFYLFVFFFLGVFLTGCDGFTSTTEEVTYTPTTEQTTIETTEETVIISFNTMGAGQLDDVEVVKGDYIPEPSEISRQGYTFEGWYIDYDGDHNTISWVDFDRHIASEDVTIYAKWTVNQYTLSFNSDCDIDYDAITQDYNTNIDEPEVPVKDGHVFLGWYIDDNFSEEFTFSTMPAKDVTLYAKWQVQEYKLSLYEGDIILNEDETIEKIDLGIYHSSMITSDNRVFTWGSNASGQLGDGTENDSLIPLDITSQFALDQNEVIIDVVLGSSMSSAISSKGKVFVWGQNFFGALGLQEPSGYLQKTPLDITSEFELNEDETIVEIELAYFHSSALTSEGRVFMWGRNGNGQIGDGNINTDVYSPADITTEFNLLDNETIIDLELSEFNSSALTSEGRIFIWGINYSDTPQDITSQFDLQAGESIGKLSFGKSHLSLLTSNNCLFMWGRNDNGQLGDIGDGGYYNFVSPTDFTSYISLNPNEKILDISLGNSHTIILTSENRILSWGNNSFGQLGDGTTINRVNPIDITNNFELDEFDSIESVIANGDFSAVFTNTKKVFFWGSNSYGQLGKNYIDNVNIPIDITSQFSLFDQDKIISIEYGDSYVGVITSDNKVYTWGYNASGRLGDGTSIDRQFPVDITEQFNLTENEVISELFFGIRNNSAAISSQGRIFVWGSNSYGQLGLGTTSGSYSPVDITDSFNLEENEKIIKVVLSDEAILVLSSEGRVFSCGRNLYGRLGTGFTSEYVDGDYIDHDTLIPVEITNNFDLNEDEKVIDIALIQVSSHALTSEGRVFAWGRDREDGQFSNKNLPYDITNRFDLNDNDKIIKIFSSRWTSFAASSEGKIFTWGRDHEGMDGTGKSGSNYTPVEFSENFNFNDEEYIIDMDFSDFHVLAITSDYRVFTWGNNASGILGDGTSISRNYPLEITSRFDLADEEIIIDIAINIHWAATHSALLTSEGRLLFWGENADMWQRNFQAGIFNDTYPVITLPSQLRRTILIEQVTLDYGTNIDYSFKENQGIYDFWLIDNQYINYHDSMPSMDINLFKINVFIKYHINYDLDGGTNHENNPIFFTIGDEVILNSPSKEGYTFLGWYDNQDFNGQIIESIPLGTSEHIQLYARWEENN